MAQTLAGLRRGDYVGVKQLSLRNADLAVLPPELSTISATLEHLDLSGNPLLSSLPSAASFPYSSFTRLKIIFLAGCSFSTFPSQLALFPSLAMIGFRNNKMSCIPENSLPPTLRWLILTGNQLKSLPGDIGDCLLLEKCMLAGNELASLPDSMANCKKLTLLRLSANAFKSLPDWLWSMPNLSFLAFGGNPCVSFSSSPPPSIIDIPTSSLTVGELLGEGASGLIYKATWETSSSPLSNQVALKSFKSMTITSDGTPADEMAAALLAGQHPNLVSVLGRAITDTTSTTLGLVLELIPPTYSTLGLPPDFDTCSRDTFDLSSIPTPFGIAQGRAILKGLAGAAQHVHEKGIMHGDLYCHNLLFSRDGDEGGHALLGDFGAATIYGQDHEAAHRIQRLEVRAFGYLIEDVLSLLGEVDEGDVSVKSGWLELKERCTTHEVSDRPSFEEIVELLHKL